jgi:hypothetical protein
MKIPVLLASTATRWLGTARIPAALASAGFEVSLLTPRNSLAEKNRFVAKVGHLPRNLDGAAQSLHLIGSQDQTSQNNAKRLRRAARSTSR